MRKLFFLPVLMCAAACQNNKPGSVSLDLRNNPEGKGTPVASFAQDSISAEQVQALMLEMAPYARSKFQDTKARQEYIEGLARFEMLASEAVKRGLAQSPEVVLAAKKAMVQQLLKQELDDKPTPVSDSELQAYYDQRKNDYVKPEMIRLSHIFFAAPKNAKERASKLAAAKAVLIKAQGLPPLDFQSFNQLVRTHTEEEATKSIDGDLRFLSFADLGSRYGSTVVDAAQKLRQPGQLSEAVVETEQGFHILKLQGRQAALNLTLDLVKPQIQNTLIQQKRSGQYQALVESLQKQYNLQVKDEAVANMKIDFVAPPVARRLAQPGFAPPPLSGTP